MENTKVQMKFWRGAEASEMRSFSKGPDSRQRVVTASVGWLSEECGLQEFGSVFWADRDPLSSELVLWCLEAGLVLLGQGHLRYAFSLDHQGFPAVKEIYLKCAGINTVHQDGSPCRNCVLNKCFWSEGILVSVPVNEYSQGEGAYRLACVGE